MSTGGGFETYAEELSAKHLSSLALLGVVVIVVFAPTDHLVAEVTGNPRFVEGMLINRACIFVLALTIFCAIRFAGIRRGAPWLMTSCFLVGSCVLVSTTDLLMPAESAAATAWIYSAYLAPFITVPLVIPLADRALHTILLTTASVLPILVAGEHGDRGPLLLVMLCFACALSVVMGEVGRQLLANQYRLREAVAGRAARLAELAPLRAELADAMVSRLASPLDELDRALARKDDEGAKESCRRAERVVRQLLELSRLRGGRTRLRADIVELGPLTEGVVEMLGAARRVAIDARTSVLVSVERGRFEEVVSSFMSRSLRAQPGAVAVIIEAGDDTAHWTIVAKNAFEDDEHDLELRLAEALVALQGGELVVERDRVTIRLPIADASDGREVEAIVAVDPEREEAVIEALEPELAVMRADPSRVKEVLQRRDVSVLVADFVPEGARVPVVVVSKRGHALADEMAELGSPALARRTRRLAELSKVRRRREMMEAAMPETVDQLNDHLATTARQVDGMLEALDTSRTNERQRIARELHDDLGQLLSGARIELALANDASEGADVRQTLEAIDMLLARAEHSIRRTSRDDPPTAVERDGLVKAVARFLEDFITRAGLRCRIDTGEEGAPVRIDASMAGEVFRILQEALNNTIKHARATRVDVALRQTKRAIVVTVRDDGRGFSEERGDRHGLRGMRERAESIGAELDVSSSATGTCVTLSIPHLNA